MKLTKAKRDAVEDANHARNALAHVSQHGTPTEKATVRAKVKARYPGIGKAKTNHVNQAAHAGRDGGGRFHKHGAEAYAYDWRKQ